MSDILKVSPEAVRSTATTLKGLNTQLNDILTTTQTKVTRLGDSWTGSAAETTIGAFNGFANKYFANYQKLIDNYVQFLNGVADSYEGVTQINKSLANNM